MGSDTVESALALIENDSSKILGITIGAHRIVTPGQHVPKADAQSAPELSFNAATGTYIIVCLDLDAPFRSFSLLSPINHWIQSGLVPKPTGDGILKLQFEDTPAIAFYAGPGPPPRSSPHRYVFILYEQPVDFDHTLHICTGGKPISTIQRIRYDLSAFEKEAKLGPVVACNYFTSN
ncbi:putative protease inhibitor [Trichoderma chlorosporum]